MRDIHYDWQRYWVEIGETEPTEYGDGFLDDPEADVAFVQQKAPKTYDEISDYSCLFLLGEGGIGKSTTISEAVDDLESDGKNIIRQDLSDISGFGQLESHIFQNEKFNRWVSGKDEIYIFLDSLDECIVNYDTVVGNIAKKIKEVSSHLPRLKLRIACRTGYWQHDKQTRDTFTELFGKENVGTFELAPLREKDAKKAAVQLGFDSGSFLEEVRRKRIVPLARVPVTFRLITELYDDNESLPETRKEIYRKGCLELCGEEKASRLRRHKLSESQRLAVAERIAALSVFGGRRGIFVEASGAGATDTDLTISEITGGTENVNGRTVEIDADGIRETLNHTGLFTGKGKNRMAWAHRSFAEFLASRYLKKRGAATEQISGLLLHPDDQEGRITPQLRGVASWIVALRPEMFDRLVEVDPDAMLESDLHDLTDDQRAQLVERLLALYRKGEVSYDPYRTTSRYSQLQHQTLDAQLKSVLADSEEPLTVHLVALDIARACGAESLCHELVEIALEKSRANGIRSRAVRLLSSDCGEQPLLRLKPLIWEAESDEDRRLQAKVLSALWPDHLDAGTVFEALDERAKRPEEDIGRVMGAMRRFFRDELLPNLSEDGIVAGLGWVRRQEHRSELSYTRAQFIDELILKAWTRGGDRIIRHLARTYTELSKRNDRVIGTNPNEREFEEEVDTSAEKRRALIKEIVQRLEEPDDGLIQSLAVDFYLKTKTAAEEDMTWALERLRCARADRTRWGWAHLISYLFPPNSTKKLSDVIEAYFEYSELQETLGPYLKPVRLGSDRAEELRESYQRRKEAREQRESAQEPIEPPPQDRIEQNLKQIEAGNPEPWINLCFNTTLEPTDRRYDPSQMILVDNPGWEKSDAQTRHRILRAAQRYVLEYEPDVSADWVKSDKWPSSMLAGYAAIRLLYDERPSFLEELDPEIWERWASACINPPVPGDSKEAREEILNIANQKIPRKVADLWSLSFEKYSRKESTSPSLPALDACWSKELSQTIKNLLTDSTLSPSIVGKLVGKLLKHNDPEAKQLAKTFTPTRQPRRNREWEISVEAAFQFLYQDVEEGWEVIWPLIERRGEWGNEVIRRMATRRLGIQTSKLAEGKVADLFLLLSTRFPQSEDPQMGSGAVGEREQIANFRDGILKRLASRGTWAAAEELERIDSELPSIDLTRQINSAKEEARKSTWRATSPENLLDLLEREENRQIRNGNQLLGVIKESLERLQRRLYGKVPAEVPAVADLWNEVKQNQALHITTEILVEEEEESIAEQIRTSTGQENNKPCYLPKDEPRLSDYVQRHLTRDIQEPAIVINREVQVQEGQKSDIYIVAENLKTGEKTAAVIEVKGCWNPNLEKKIKTQLKERYLHQGHAQHGLYLIGWFLCPKWHSSDYRKDRTPKMSLEEARDHFDQKASSLTDSKRQISSFVLDATWQEN